MEVIGTLKRQMKHNAVPVLLFLLLMTSSCEKVSDSDDGSDQIRERISFNDNWRFMKYDSTQEVDNLIYDIRPEIRDRRDDKQADSKPTEAVATSGDSAILKPWIMPTGNDFIKDNNNRYKRPEGNPGSDHPFVKSDFDDSGWKKITLPHDWAIEGPFYEGYPAPVGGGMGRLPSPGVGWYRKNFEIPEEDRGKSIYLDIDGAMSYAMVWLNGQLVGGWPYGYTSWRVDLTPYLNFGERNQLSIRLDNPESSSRWYPGGGIYRNVWLVKTNAVHVGNWGTFVTTDSISENSAIINLEVRLVNDTEQRVSAELISVIYELDQSGTKGNEVARFKEVTATLAGSQETKVASHIRMSNPKLWGPPPTQQPHMYLIETSVTVDGEIIDVYPTSFGIRSLEFDPDQGLLVNGEHIFIKGVNMHHDLGALGAAFNLRAAERQLEKLVDLGANAIRMAHNPPAPEVLELTDKMGFLVVDELYDSWERRKTPHDFHLIFPDWYEQDLRAMVRRDRNHPSVIIWSTGNEVGEQYTGEEGAALTKKLATIVKEEDPTRPTSASMNYAQATMEMPEEVDVLNLNYQGEGIRDAPEYVHLREGRISTTPAYPSFHEKFPDKMIISSENAAALSSRGTYIFPVSEGISSPIRDGIGGDDKNQYVSSYELYTADFGSSADKVFASIDKHPYVAGGFVWSGWDYLGEPTPYYGARSSYYGIIDLAGFEKDRYYLYQARWRPDHPMAHILPHWNWPDRIGKITPVHVFTSGDEAELFLNGESLGRKKKGEYEYRLRWDDVRYDPGKLKVVAYKNNEVWAEDSVRTTGEPARLELSVDRRRINANSKDLAFITVRIVDEQGNTVPDANNTVTFELEGPGRIVATDNGDPTDLTPFPSQDRKAFSGLALGIIGSTHEVGEVLIYVSSEGLEGAELRIETVD